MQELAAVGGLPETVQRRLPDYARRLSGAGRINERWTVGARDASGEGAGGTETVLSCDCSGLRLTDGRLAMLVHAKPLSALEQPAAPELHLSRMVENLPMAAAYVEGERISLNHAAERLIGYRQDELPTMEAWFRAAYPGHDQEIRQRYDAARLTAASVMTELQVTRKDGVRRWIRFFAYLTHGGEVWLMEDVSDQRATLEALHQERAILQSLINSMPDVVFFKDRDGVFQNYNRAFLDYVGQTPNLNGRLRDIDMVDDNAAERRRQTDLRAMREGMTRGEEWFVYPDGRRRLMETVKTACRDPQDNILGVVGISRDVTDRREIEEMLRRSEAEKDHLANHDPLTGLPNRRLFFARTEAALARAQRIGQPLALLFIDLDGFKPVNDQLGHDAGDKVLRVTAERLTACLRASDLVARIGGDEFTVLLEGAGSLADVERVAAKLIHTLSAEVMLGRNSLSVGASVGIALYPRDANTVQDLLKAADDALYQAKYAGRGRFMVCDTRRRA
ncbi:sensor domain-containing diguanylate cyclase [Azospirillum sp. TSH100]|uniref:sensor domain-containing diguanylate cyclase n=1 Tax=Azospirillum sp. TSH100 TaxID=652764 RepID=UPI001FFFBE9C|nr:sensor domain-containing diguanylate cyclase [Azospirillum sp. TSH100]